ncbi:hypothetical protein [Chamaesiphon polymorphus]|uniref:hypothetical protein n=1 Tax=Chamaesiphon polymorphus TaxID=2107691 RepID=UPI0015E6526A|nr:hypothetical protein [Chamaesiphon polymorphus]
MSIGNVFDRYANNANEVNLDCIDRDNLRSYWLELLDRYNICRSTRKLRTARTNI